MSQNTQRSFSQNGSQGSDSSRPGSQGSSRTYVPLGHNDEYSPRTQAWRDTPPSSQQYSSWTRDQRNSYREEVARNATRSMASELEVRRDGENWWRNQYDTLLRDTARNQGNSTAEPIHSGRPVRVAAIRTNYRLGSQGSTDNSQRSNGSYEDSPGSSDSSSP